MTLRLVHNATAPTATATAPTATAPRRGAVWYDVGEPLRDRPEARNELYLVPPGEREDGKPGAKVVLWSCVGEGLPQPAWLGRWKYLARIDPRVVVSELVHTLRANEALLTYLCTGYAGSTTDTPDGQRRGRWRPLAQQKETELADLRVTVARVPTYTRFVAPTVDPDFLAGRVRAAGSVGAAALALMTEAETVGVWLDAGEVEDALRRAVAP